MTSIVESVSGSPDGRIVQCPKCGAEAFAIVPKDSTIVDSDEDTTGKVKADCPDCNERFPVYFRSST